MRPLLFLALGAALVGATIVSPAAAAPHLCGQYEAIIDKLPSQFGEKAVASGTSRNGRTYVEFWASKDSGSWSVVTVMPNGVSCLTSAGQDFQAMPEKLEKDRSPVT